MALVLYCPQCGKPMRVASEHTRVAIGCPHCNYAFRPAAITLLNDRESAADTPGAIVPPSSAFPTTPDAGPRSRVAAGLLGIFFGCLGLHRFYLGYPGIGAIQLGLTLAGFLLVSRFGCCVPVVWLWGTIEGVFCLLGWMRDADGRSLRV